MVNCCAYGCNSRSSKKEPGITFHRFPKDPRRHAHWIKNLHITDWTPTRSDRLCSKHFEQDMFYVIGNKTNLLDEAIPTIFENLPKYLQEKTKRRRKMVLCWAADCSHNNMTEKCNFFRFPKDDETRNRWTQLTRRTTSPSPADFLCSCHFIDGKKENDPTMFAYNVDQEFEFSAAQKDTKENLDVDVADGGVHSSTETESCITCAVPGCASTSVEDCVELFPLPESKIIRNKWLKFCSLYDVDTMTAYICSKHFEESSYITEIKNFGNVTCLIRALDPEAVPVINDSNSSIKLKEECVENMEEDEPTIELDSEVYGHIKTQADLSKLKIYNDMLKKKIKVHKFNLKSTRTNLRQKEALLASLESQISKKSILYEDVLGKVFSRSQIKLLSGHKKTHWTEDDLAVGLTIRYLSSKTFYSYLTNTLKFPLPGLSSIQRYITINKKRGGISSRSILKE